MSVSIKDGRKPSKIIEKKPSRMKASKVSEIVIKNIISLKIISDIFNVVICGIHKSTSHCCYVF